MPTTQFSATIYRDDNTIYSAIIYRDDKLLQLANQKLGSNGVVTV